MAIHVATSVAAEEGFENMHRRVSDIRRANNLIGFEPTVGVDHIIDLVVEEQRS